jgi:hypothetical protein
MNKRISEAEVQRRKILENELASSERKPVINSLVELMILIIGWEYYPKLRKQEWADNIEKYRVKITACKLAFLHIDDEYIQHVWQASFERARELTRSRFGTYGGEVIFPLTWEQVFERGYKLNWIEKLARNFNMG